MAFCVVSAKKADMKKAPKGTMACGRCVTRKTLIAKSKSLILYIIILISTKECNTQIHREISKAIKKVKAWPITLIQKHLHGEQI